MSEVTTSATKITLIARNIQRSDSAHIHLMALYGDFPTDGNPRYAQEYYLDANTGQLVETQKYDQEYKTVMHENKETRVPISQFHRTSDILDTNMLSKVHALVKNMNNSQLPYEMLITCSLDNKLAVIKQKALDIPITRFKNRENPAVKTIPIISLHAGVASGYTRNIKSIGDAKKARSGDVAILHSMLPLKHLPKTAAVLITKKALQNIHSLKTIQFHHPAAMIEDEVAAKLINGLLVKLTEKELRILSPIHTIKPTSIQKKIKLPNISGKIYAELSGVQHAYDNQTFGVSLLDGSALVKSLLKKYPDEKYAIALINYIRQTLCVTPQIPLLYQSVCTYAHPEPGTNHGLNAIVGSHGAHYIINKPQFFTQELDALYRLLHIYKFSDATLVIPHVRTIVELHKVKEIVRAAHLTRSHKFKLFMTVDVPSNIILLDDFLDEGIDGIIADREKMTELLLGVDTRTFENSRDTMINNPTVLKSLEHCAALTSRRRIPFLIKLPDNPSDEMISETIKIKPTGIIINENIASSAYVKN